MTSLDDPRPFAAVLRDFLGRHHLRQTPETAALFGASLLAAADVVARMLGGVPVGVVTAIIGAPFFLVLLRRARTGYEL